MTLDLTDDEDSRARRPSRHALNIIPPVWPGLDPLKAILAKLEPPKPMPEPLPPLPAAGPRVGRGGRR